MHDAHHHHTPNLCQNSPQHSLSVFRAFPTIKMAEESKTSNLSPIAQPLAGEKLQKKLFKVVKKGESALPLAPWEIAVVRTMCGPP